MNIILIFPLLILSMATSRSDDVESGSFEDDDGLEPINLGEQGYFQGDVILKKPDHRNAILRSQRWHGGLIYFTIDSAYPEAYMLWILKAIKSIEKHTCVRFKPRVKQRNYISIANTSGGCFSEGVGKRGGKQTISLMLGSKATCFTRAIIIHELLHAVGLWHEHMRYDRASHIIIHWEHLRAGAAEQFDVMPQKRSSTYDVPYDYKSVMHYDAYSFSGDGNVTIEPTNTVYLAVIGKAKTASEHDWEKVRKIYECENKTETAQANGNSTILISTDPPHETTETTGITITRPRVGKVGNCSAFKKKCDRYKWVRKKCPQVCSPP